MEKDDKIPSTLQKVVENLTHPVSSGTSKEIPAGAFEAGSNIREVDFKKGSVGFAKSKNGDMEDSEFFILLSDAPLFEGEYTPLGNVTHGFAALTKIKSGNKSEYVLRPDFINSLRMLSEISN